MMRSCLAVIAAVTLIVLLTVGWLTRDRLGELISSVTGRGETEVEAPLTTEQLARQAENKVVALGQGELEEARLTVDELNSWIEYGLKRFFPTFLSEVTMGLADEERVALSGRVATREVPGIERMGPFAMFMGDTADVQVRGRVDGLAPGRGVFYIDEVQVGALTLPEALRDQLLAQLRGGGRSTLPANSVGFELPKFVGDVAVREDGIVLRRAARAD